MSRHNKDPFDFTSFSPHLPTTHQLQQQQQQQQASNSNTNNGSFQSPSRIPLYVANGLMPHHSSPFRSSRSAGGHSNSSYGIHDSGYSSNHHFYQPSYHHGHITHPHLQSQQSAAPFRIVPHSIHLQHQQHMLSHISSSRKSTPNSHRTTPLTSGSNTPNSSHRPSLTHGCVRSATLPAKLPACNLVQTPNTARGFRYDEYMPLCELQRALKKGQVLEVRIYK